MIIDHGARSPSGLYSTTGTLPIQRAPTHPSILSHRSSALGRGRPVLGRGDRPREPRRRGGTRRGQALCEAVCLREANWYPTTCVGASETIRISANRGECVCVEFSRSSSGVPLSSMASELLMWPVQEPEDHQSRARNHRSTIRPSARQIGIRQRATVGVK